MVTSEELQTLCGDKTDDEHIVLTAFGNRGVIGERLVLIPGVAGQIVGYDADGDTQVRVKVRGVRHALRLLAA